MIKNIKLIIAFLIIQLTFSFFGSEKENTKEKKAQSITTLACAIKNNYFSHIKLPFELQRLIAQYAQEWKKNEMHIPNCNIPYGNNLVIFSYDSRFIIYFGRGNHINVIDLTNAKYNSERIFLEAGNILCLASSPIANYFASGDFSGRIKLWDLTNKTCFFTFDNNFSSYKFSESINFLEYSNNGNRLVSVDSYNKINLWDLRNNKLLNSLNNIFKDDITAIASNNGDKIVVGFKSGIIRIIDLNLMSILETFDKDNPRPVYGLKYSPSQGFIACGHDDGTVQIINKNNICLYTINTKENRISDIQIDISPDGLYLVFKHREDLKIWNLQSTKFVEMSKIDLFDPKLVYAPNGCYFIVFESGVEQNQKQYLFTSKEHELLYSSSEN